MRSLLKNIHAGVRHLLFREYATSFQVLGAFRIYYALMFLLVVGIPDFGWLADLEDFMYNPPPGLARLFQGFPNSSMIQVMHYGILVSLLLVLIGWHTRLASYAFAILVMTCYSWEFSTGKIDHYILLWLAPICCGWHWGKAYSMDALTRPPVVGYRSWPVTFYALFMGFAYFSAGIPKLLGGWLDPGFSMFKTYVFQGYFKGKRSVLVDFLMNLDAPILWEIFDWLALSFEIGFLFAILKLNWFRFFTVIAVCFHLTVYLTMDIWFFRYLCIYPLFWLAVLFPLLPVTHPRRLLYTLIAFAAAYLGYEIMIAPTDIGITANDVVATLVLFFVFVCIGIIVLIKMWRQPRNVLNQS